MLKLTSTNKYTQTHGVKILVYGRAGSGKTLLCSTAPTPIIIQCEGGLLSLRNHNIPVMDVATISDLDEALEKLRSKKFSEHFETVCLDSISEMAERVLADAKKHNKDGRKAYGETNEQMDRIIKAFRDLNGYNVYFSAKEKKLIDEDGIMQVVPSMPGTVLTSNLPYLFDGVFYLKVEVKDNKCVRHLITEADYRYDVSDRSGALATKETPNLKAIFEKIARS